MRYQQILDDQSIDSAFINILTDQEENNFLLVSPIKVYEHLTESGITINKNHVFSRVKSIKRGKAILTPLAEFKDEYSERFEKDRCYEGFWTLIDIEIPFCLQRRYIGLSSNQIDKVINRVNSPIPIHVCELKKDTYERLCQISEGLNNKYNSIKSVVHNVDIFDYLEKEERQFNIFDLDLMCKLPEGPTLQKWVDILYKSSCKGANCIYLATSIGRCISVGQYKELIKYFNLLLHTRFNNVKISEFNYRDRIRNMYGQRIVVVKE